MDFVALLNSAITFAVVMGIFVIVDRLGKANRFKSKGWKFWVGLFAIYMVVTYLLKLF